MKKLFLLLFLLLSTSLFSIEITDDIKLRGFATLDATLSTEDSLVSLSNELEQNEANFNYSLLGAQLNWDISDSVDVMVQGLYAKNAKDEPYQATLEWALLGYNFGDNYRFRIGKMKIPFMRGTEFRYINYSFLWTRPQIVQGVNGFDDLYGVDLIKNCYVGDVDYQLQATLGQAKHKKKNDENHYLYNFSALASYEGSWLRLSGGQTVFDHIGEQDELINKDEVLTFISAETEVHFDALTLYGGYSFNQNDSIPNVNFLYASLSYEIDMITPYLLYSRKEITSLPFPGVLPIPGERPSNDDYHISKHHSIGMRYDISSNFALKAQYDLSRVETSVVKEENNIYTLTLDMVF